jgi:hypothetical protein
MEGYFLNIEYIFLRIYEIFTGIHIEPGDVLPASFYIAGQFAIGGLALSVLLLAFLVYVQIKLTITEHEGFHAKEAETYREAEMAELSSKNLRWERVMELASSPSDSDWRRAILEADIMLGNLLQEKGYRGETIGEQLKDVNPLQFNTLDLAWQAHKMRNAVAHLGEAFPLSERDVQATINQYARVFEEFGII